MYACACAFDAESLCLNKLCILYIYLHVKEFVSTLATYGFPALGVKRDH